MRPNCAFIYQSKLYFGKINKHIFISGLSSKSMLCLFLNRRASWFCMPDSFLLSSPWNISPRKQRCQYCPKPGYFFLPSRSTKVDMIFIRRKEKLQGSVFDFHVWFSTILKSYICFEDKHFGRNLINLASAVLRSHYIKAFNWSCRLPAGRLLLPAYLLASSCSPGHVIILPLSEGTGKQPFLSSRL